MAFWFYNSWDDAQLRIDILKDSNGKSFGLGLMDAIKGFLYLIKLKKKLLLQFLRLFLGRDVKIGTNGYRKKIKGFAMRENRFECIDASYMFKPKNEFISIENYLKKEYGIQIK